MSKKEETSVAKKEEQALAPADLMAAMEADAGSGFENVTADDRAKPYIVLLQDLTPLCKKTSPSYVPGGAAGMFYNTVTGELTDGDKGLHVIPCGYTRLFIERDKGKDGAFIRMLDIGDPLVRDAKMMTEQDGKKVLVTPEGTVITDVRYHFVLASNDGGIAFEPAIIGLKKTQISKSKGWNSAMERQKIPGKNGMIRVAPWYQIYHVTSKPESKDNHSWYGWDFKFSRLVQDAQLAHAGKAFHDMAVKGHVVVDESTAKTADDDAPF